MEQNVQKAEQMKYRLADAMKQCMAKMPIERDYSAAACGTERNDKTDILPSFSG